MGDTLTGAGQMAGIGGDAASGFMMGGPAGGVIGAGLGLIGGILGNEQSASNAAAANATTESMLGQQEQAQINFAQNAPLYEVTGLKAAGLNPVLAASQGASIGGAVPQGAVQMPAYKNPIEAATTSATVAATLDSIKASTEASRAQASLTSAEAGKVAMETPYIPGYQEAVQKNLGKEANWKANQTDYIQAQIALGKPKAEVRALQGQAWRDNAAAQSTEYGFARDIADQSFWQGRFGEIAPYIHNLVGPGASSAASIRNLFR